MRSSPPRGGEIVGEEYFPLDHTDYERVVDDIMATGAEVVFNTIVPPGLTPFLEQLHRAGFTARGGHIVCTYFDENFLNLVPAEHVEGLYGCLDYYRDVDDPFSIELLNRYEGLFPGSAMFTAGSACTGTYRALKLWEAAVNEAGSLNQDDVIAALDHARIAQGPGGPAEMVPGPAPRADEHVHRPVRGRHVQRGEEPGPHRPQGVRGRTVLTQDPNEREAGPFVGPASRAASSGRHARRGAVPFAAPDEGAPMDDAATEPLATLDFSLRTLQEQVVDLRDDEMDIVSNCEPWTVRRLASHALNNQLFWGGVVTGDQPVSFEETMGAVPHEGDLARYADEVVGRARAMWRTDGVLDAIHVTPLGELPGAAVINFAIIDALCHAWDLGASRGNAIEFPPETIPTIAVVVAATCTDAARDHDLIQPVAPTAADATDTERLMALAGRSLPH